MGSLLDDLNDKQREAVTAPLGPVLVLAGAGSGKTRALTFRITRLIAEGLFQPDELLALTFTNKAAGEMRDRIMGLLVKGQGSQSPKTIPAAMPYNHHPGITMGTFHSVCVRILRQDIEKLGLGYTRNFVIFDEDDRRRLLKQITLELGLGERYQHQLLGYFISQAKNRLVAPGELALDNPDLEEALTAVYEEYAARMREQNAVDFDDLLGLTCELFSTDKKTLEKHQDKFKYILVDEYQDTNHAQYFMLKKLVGKRGNIFVVGDDAQSIYGFRGANMQNILNFKKDYPRAKVIMLEQNYRSTQKVLDVAHQVIALNPFQYEKKLWTESRGGEKVSLYEALDEHDEARFVLSVIANPERVKQPQRKEIASSPSALGGQDPRNDEISYTPILDSFENKFSIPQNLKDFVVLYRTHAQSRSFEEALLAAAVPYQIIGGIKFYERKEIKDALAYLRLLLNPKDLVSLSRVVNAPPRGIGGASLKQINQALQKYKFSYQRLLNNLDQLGLSSRALKGARGFFELYNLGHSGRLNLLGIMDFLLTRSGYKESLLKEGEEGLSRWENIEELLNVAGKYKSLPWQEGLVGFLEEAALMTDLDTMEEARNKLTLMTLHSAKGLEFERVFLVGLEEGLLPHSRSLLDPEELAEEIRLAYVGVTRAKQELYLSYARQRQHYGEIRTCAPSRIIKAIPKRLLNRISNV